MSMDPDFEARAKAFIAQGCGVKPEAVEITDYQPGALYFRVHPLPDMPFRGVWRKHAKPKG